MANCRYCARARPPDEDEAVCCFARFDELDFQAAAHAQLTRPRLTPEVIEDRLARGRVNADALEEQLVRLSPSRALDLVLMERRGTTAPKTPVVAQPLCRSAGRERRAGLTAT